MGNFSWLIDGEPILNNSCGGKRNKGYDHGEHFTVYMHAPNGRVWKEKKYGGFGVFGRKDYFKLMAEMNGLETRNEAIKIQGDKGTLYPILTRSKHYDGDFNMQNECDPDQGNGCDLIESDSDSE
jgi:hypothetical protein